MSDDFYEKLRERLSVPDGQILTYDEVMRWPEGKLDELLRLGKIREGPTSETIECIECPERCPIEPDVRKHPETDELFGVYVCPHDEDIGRFTVDLNRRLRWEIVDVTPKKKRQRKKKKAVVNKTKAETSFKPWDSHGEACFVLDGNRIKFWNGNDLTDLKLKSGSRTHTLIPMLYEAQLTKADVKKAICTEKTSPFDAVRDVNRTLNDKIKKLNIQNVPPNIEFISREERTEQYYCALPIQTKPEFDMS